MNQLDTVSARHYDWLKTYDDREIYRDVIEGTLRLRSKRKQYLPQFPAESDDDYKFRCDTATCFNLTKKTRDVMSGLVFREPIKLQDDVDPEIVALWENIDNAGTHGDVFCRKAFDASFEGFGVILVDAPEMQVRTAEEQMRLGMRPYWVFYDADHVINWQYRVNPMSKSKELAMIVLQEETFEPTGQFTFEEVERYRVFRIIEDSVTFQVYREVEINGRDEYILESEGVLPELTQIPVAVVGGLGDSPKLLDIALKNLEHFQTYSDYKSLIHKTCVPLPVGKGVELGGGDSTIVVGGSTMIQTSAQGDFRFAEVSGSSLDVVRTSLNDNREEISLMGLSLLADKTAKVNVTATEALLNNIGETAELRVMARSMQDAIELALGHTAEYLMLPREAGGSVEMGTAWSGERDEYAVQLEDLNLRADIANKLTGIMSQEWIIKFLGVKNEDEVREILAQIAEMDALIVEKSPNAAEGRPLEEDNREEYRLVSGGIPEGRETRLIETEEQEELD